MWCPYSTSLPEIIINPLITEPFIVQHQNHPILQQLRFIWRSSSISLSGRHSNINAKKIYSIIPMLPLWRAISALIDVHCTIYVNLKVEFNWKTLPQFERLFQLKNRPTIETPEYSWSHFNSILNWLQLKTHQFNSSIDLNSTLQVTSI